MRRACNCSPARPQHRTNTYKRHRSERRAMQKRLGCYECINAGVRSRDPCGTNEKNVDAVTPQSDSGSISESYAVDGWVG
jgi:hypothetical protein